MSANDHFSGSPESLRPADEFVPSVVPAGSPADDPLVLPADDEDVPLVQAVPRPPHPGFWWSVFWTVIFVLVPTILSLVILIPTVGIMAALSPDPRGYLQNVVHGQRIETTPSENPNEPPTKKKVLTREFIMVNIPAILCQEIFTLILAFVVIRWTMGKDWPRRLALRRPGVTHLFLAALAFVAMLFVVGGVYGVAKNVLPTFAYQDYVTALVDGWPAWFGLLVVGLAPGVGEELWFRGFLGRGLVGRYGVIGGLLITSILFGIVHMDPPHILAAAVMGFTFHFVYITTRSLYVPMLLHFTNNSLSVLNRFLTDSTAASSDPTEQVSLAVFVGAVLLLAAVGWTLYQTRVRFASAAGDGMPIWQPDHPGVEHPPPDSGTVLHRPWPGWVLSGLVVAGLSAFVATIYLPPMMAQAAGSP